jgi:hypothetical protein
MNIEFLKKQLKDAEAELSKAEGEYNDILEKVDNLKSLVEDETHKIKIQQYSGKIFMTDVLNTFDDRIITYYKVTDVIYNRNSLGDGYTLLGCNMFQFKYCRYHEESKETLTDMKLDRFEYIEEHCMDNFIESSEEEFMKELNKAINEWKSYVKLEDNFRKI